MNINITSNIGTSGYETKIIELNIQPDNGNEKFETMMMKNITQKILLAADNDNELDELPPKWSYMYEEFIEQYDSKYFPKDLTIKYTDNNDLLIVNIVPLTPEEEDYLIEYMMYINCGNLRKNNAFILIPESFPLVGREVRKKNTEPRDLILIGTKYVAYSIYRVLDKSTSQMKNRRYDQYWMICEKTELQKNCIRFFCNNRDMLPFILGKHGNNLMSFKTYVRKYIEAHPECDFTMHPKIIFKLSAARKVDLPK